MRSFGVLCLFLFVCVAVGCGGGGLSLSGNATFDGEPIPYGEIIFTPDGDDENVPVNLEIRDGRFATPEGASVAVGAYVVSVDGYATDPYEEGAKQLFPTYSVKVNLEKGQETYDIEVPASADE